MNAYRPNLELPRREPPPPKPVEEPKSDFGRSIKKLMKRPQGSPSTQSKNHRKEGIQRTPTVVIGYPDVERSISRDSKLQQSQKPKRPLSANIDSTLIPPPLTFGQGPTVLLPLEANFLKADSVPTRPSPPVSPTTKTTPAPARPSPPVSPQTKTPVPARPSPPVTPQTKTPKPSTVQQVPPPSSSQPKAAQPPATTNPQTKTPKTSTVQQTPIPPKTPKPKSSSRNGQEEAKMPPESAGALSAATVQNLNPNQAKKKVSIQEEKRRSGTEGFPDAPCLIISGSNIGRFLPSRHVSISKN